MNPLITDSEDTTGFPETALRELLRDERAEIEKHRWCLGVQMGCDPLTRMSMNDICLQWITTYIVEFRRYWDEQWQLRTRAVVVCVEQDGAPGRN